MRIRNILIKTHNPPLNPSLQNHLHSVVLLHAATATAQSGPLFYLSSSLIQGSVSLCLPLVSVIFDPLSLDFQTRCSWKKCFCEHFCIFCLKWKMRHMPNEEEMGWELPSEIVHYEEKVLWPTPLKDIFSRRRWGLRLSDEKKKNYSEVGQMD